MPIDNDIFSDMPGAKKASGEADIFADLPKATVPRATGMPSFADAKAETGKPPAPANSRVALNSISKGIAGGADAFLNTPNNVLNLIKAGAGSLTNLVGRPDLSPDITPNPDFARRAITAFGAIGPAGEPLTPTQRVIDYAGQFAGNALTAPANSTRGLAQNLAVSAGSGALAGGTKELTGSDTAAAAVGMLAPVAVNSMAGSAVNRIEAMRNRQSANVVRDETLAAARKEGYVVPGSEVNQSALNNRLESFAGKAALKQDASIRNQEVTNKLAAKELGLPEGTAITPGKLEAYRNQVSAPYQEIAKISPMADKALFDLRQARSESQAQWKFYERSANPDAQKAAIALDQRASMLETALERIAVRFGKPDLVNDLRDARTKIAKSYDIEKSLNVGDASVSAPVIGRALDSGKPLSGNLETIGRFQQGPGRKFTAEGASVPAPGVSGTNFYGGAVLGAAGNSMAGPAGVIAGGIPLLRGPMRSLLLSDVYQNSRFANPNYRPSVTTRLMSKVPQYTPQELALISLINERSANNMSEQK